MSVTSDLDFRHLQSDRHTVKKDIGLGCKRQAITELDSQRRRRNMTYLNLQSNFVRKHKIQGDVVSFLAVLLSPTLSNP